MKITIDVDGLTLKKQSSVLVLCGRALLVRQPGVSVNDPTTHYFWVTATAIEHTMTTVGPFLNSLFLAYRISTGELKCLGGTGIIDLGDLAS